MIKPTVHSSYSHKVFTKRRFEKAYKNVRKAVRYINFEAIAFRGSSGAAMSFPLALARNKGLLHVRKDSSHSSLKVEGLIGVKNYIVIDDFVSSGETLRIIKKEIEVAHVLNMLDTPKCIAVVLYNVPRGSKIYNRYRTREIFGKVPIIIV